MENCCKARSAPSCSSLTPTARKTCPHRGCCPPLPPSPPSPGPSGTARPTALASRGSRRCGTRLVAYSGNLPGLTAPQRPPLLHPLPVLGSRAAPAEPLGTRHLPLRRRRGRPGPGRPPAGRCPKPLPGRFGEFERSRLSRYQLPRSSPRKKNNNTCS